MKPHLITPWIIHEAEVALWTAWQDGMPFRGPGSARGSEVPVFQLMASLAIEETTVASAATGHDWRSAVQSRDAQWSISVGFPDGATADAVGRVRSRLSPGGVHILTVRFIDRDGSGEWTKFQFFYVTLETDAGSESGQVMQRSLRFKSSWLQESAGSADIPPLEPVVLGEVDWVCGPRHVTALTYDPSTETWTSTTQNETGDGSRYVNFSPVSEDNGADVALSCYLPRVVDGFQTPPEVPQANILWQNTLLLRIGSETSALHHGLVAMGVNVQTLGIPEPLLASSQSRMLDEPVVVFRFLRRIYATLGHGFFAVPALTENEAPPFTHDPSFRLGVPGACNPATGRNGLVLLPEGAWLDGTVMEA